MQPCHTFGPVTLFQPNLPHRVVIWGEKKTEEGENGHVGLPLVGGKLAILNKYLSPSQVSEILLCPAGNSKLCSHYPVTLKCLYIFFKLKVIKPGFCTPTLESDWN